MTAPICVDPASFTDAADGFLAIHGQAAQVMSTLAGVLNGSGGSAGSDDTGRDWSNTYDPAANEAMIAGTALINGAGQMNNLLHANAANHDNADNSSGLDENPNEPAFPPGSVPAVKVPNIPKAYGGDSDPPFGWSLISQALGGAVWPNGHQDKLRAMAAAWKAAAVGLRSAATPIAAAKGLITDQQSPEIQQILSQTDLLSKNFSDVADHFDDLGKACADYAHSLDEAHSTILHELRNLIGSSVLIEGLGAAGSWFFGLSELGAQSAELARVGRAAAKVREALQALSIAAKAASTPAMAAGGALGATMSDLTPLLNARAIMWSARAGGEGGPTVDAAAAAARQRGREMVGGKRAPMNSKYAGGPYPLRPDLAEKYPNGVQFTAEGFPDFAPYAIKTVHLDQLGPTRDADFNAANKAAGLPGTPPGYTWHHVEDMHTMQLVPSDLHKAVNHTGGWARFQNGGK